MDLKLNKPQARFILNKPKEAVSIWGRATGKSFVIAFLINSIVKNMPRSTWLLVGTTFKQVLEITLPSTLNALERLGYYRNKHYFIGRTPPASWNWPQPIMQSGKTYHNTIYFYTGTVFKLVSQDRNSTSVRGFNADGIICDESLQLDKIRFDDEVSPTNRGNLDYFRNVPFHHGLYHFTSMPIGAEGDWLLEYGAYVAAMGIPYREIQNQIINLQLELIDSPPNQRMQVWNRLKQLYSKSTFPLSPTGLLYSEANAFDNLLNLGIEYLINERARISNDLQYKREMLNYFTKKIEGGFYSGFSREKHCYRGKYNYSYVGDLDKYNFKDKPNSNSSQDDDLISSLPLYAGIDWGAKINFMVIAQRLSSINQINIINNIFVKAPLILDDLAIAFADYYSQHPTKELYLWYDNSGNNRQANSKLTYAQQFKKNLTALGWNVVLRTKGNTNPEYERKYLLLQRIFDETDPQYPKIRFNSIQCRELLISMELAPVKDDRGKLRKDKSSETKDSIAQEQATHGSDALDSLIYGEFASKLKKTNIYMPASIR